MKIKSILIILLFIGRLFSDNYIDVSTPVAELSVRGGPYVREVALYTLEAGIPLEEFRVIGVPVDKLVTTYGMHTAGEVSDGFASVGKVIADGQSAALLDIDRTKLNDAYGNATYNNRGSILIDN